MNSILTKTRRNPYITVLGNFADKLDVSDMILDKSIYLKKYSLPSL